MPRLRVLLLAALSLVAAATAGAQPADAGPTGPPAPHRSAKEILLAVRTQQAQAREQRKHWVFDQEVFVRLLRGKNQLAREELRRYRVRPTASSQERDLLSLEGKVAIKGKVYPYADPEYRTGDIDLDGEIAESFAKDLLFHKEGAEGPDDTMYPLSPRMMEQHQFAFHGEESYQGRTVYRFTFEPNKNGKSELRGFWEGEVLVDRDALAPVLVVTHQARKIPLAVRTMLGTNVEQVGFKLEYAEMADGTWFPSRYSGEFRLRVLFGYARRIALSARNHNFVRARAESEIHYDMDKPAEDAPAGEASNGPEPSAASDTQP